MAVDAIFEYCGIKEDNFPPVYKVVAQDPSSESSSKTAHAWLRNCLETHESCNESTNSNPPKRLIRVGNDDQDPVLVETASIAQQTRWAALSYCWGGEPSKKLGMKTMSELQNGVALNEFDPAIRDAILVTRALGLVYIWIDALCVIQDKNSGEWNEEASRMNDIY